MEHGLDEEYHYEIFYRLPDLHDTEDTDGFDPDVRKRMDFLNYTHSHPDGAETQGVDTVDIVYMCRTVSGNETETQDEPDRRLGILECDWEYSARINSESADGHNTKKRHVTRMMMNLRTNLEVGDVLMVAYILLSSVWGNSIVDGTVGYGTMTI